MKEPTPKLYPLKFDPIFKKKVWGGDKLNLILNKKEKGNIGESWEISDVDDNISVVSNGALKGRNIEWLISTYKEALVGEEVYREFGDKFPLLFKFIDAKEDLSVQVHPGDHLAKKRHNSFGKTEMWYVLDGEKDSRLILGFKDKISSDEYMKALSENKIVDLLNSEKVQKGDAFIINTGTVHAIGAGVLLAEIQQTSDITYRIYDWDRPDTDGNMRELHTGLAMDAIDFSPSKSKLKYKVQINLPVRIGKTPFFEVNKLTLSKPFNRSLSSIPSFKVYMCLEGQADIECEGFYGQIEKGETILVPAQINEITFNTSSASFLEVYIP